MDVLCVGMYRACSTWQYNLASQLIEQHRQGRRLGFIHGEHYCSEPGAWRVLKSHDRHDTFAEALRQGQAVAFYSYRDLRDVAFSLVHKFQSSFEQIIERRLMLRACLDNDHFWTTRPGVLVQRYERIMADPEGAVGELANHLGIELAVGEANRLAQEHSLEANRSRTAALAGELRENGIDLERSGSACLFDPRTLLHWNHIRSGTAGDWRQHVTPRQLLYLAAECTDWLIERGYEHSSDWWQEIAKERDWTLAELGQGWLEALRDPHTRQLHQQIEMLEQARDAQARAVASREDELRQVHARLVQRALDHEHTLNALHHTQGHLALAQERLATFEEHGQTAVAAARGVARIIGGFGRLYRRWRGGK